MRRSASYDSGSASEWSVIGPRPSSWTENRWGRAAGRKAAASAEAEGPPATGAGGASTSGTTGEVPEEAPELPSSTILRWAGLVRKFRKIRKYQRYFHNAGERLKDFPTHLRGRIAFHYPKQ